MDLVTDFAMPFPIMVIAEILGVDAVDRRKFREWSFALLEASASRRIASQDTYSRAERATVELLAYFEDVITDRQANPREDLVSALAGTRHQPGALSAHELLANCVHLLTAGHETTVNLISKGMLALLRTPAALEALRCTDRVRAASVDEILRFDSPVQMVTRWAREDVVIGGRHIQAGQLVSLMLGSANRDEERFFRADQLELQRFPNPHLSFGSGNHVCLGASLAKLEGRVAFELLKHLPDLQVEDGPISYRDSIVFHGPQSLLLTWSV